MSKISPIDDVIEKGTPYYEGKSFRRWSLIMRLKYGKAVTPYLEDAWKMIKEKAKSSDCNLTPIPRETRAYKFFKWWCGFITDRSIDWKTFLAGLAFGLVLVVGCFSVGRIFGIWPAHQSRYVLVHTGAIGVAFKLDTWTGQVWQLVLVDRDRPPKEIPVTTNQSAIPTKKSDPLGIDFKPDQ